MKRVTILLVILTLLTGVAAFAQNSPVTGKINPQPNGANGFVPYPALITYQGVLTLPSGLPATDGSYDLQFSVFSTLTGGSSYWTETHSTVSVQHGTFSVNLGSVTPFSFNFNQPIYLQVTALSGPGLSGAVGFSPRTLLTASPFSLGPWQSNGFDVTVPFGRVGIGTGSPAQPLDVAGNAIINDSLTVGSSSNSGRLLVYRNGSTSPVATLSDYAFGAGGDLELYDGSGTNTHNLEPDFNGSGAGWFHVSNGSSGSAFRVDGNYNGTLDPHVEIEGAYRSVRFYLDQTADASVELPDSSISAREILDEPGVVRSSNGSSTVITNSSSTATNLLSAVITVPGPGYVIANAGCIIGITGSTIYNVSASVERGSTTVPSGGNYSLVGSQGEVLSGSTTRWYSLSNERVFFVNSPGDFDYYFNAARPAYGTETANAWYTHLTLVYVPTSYGPVAGIAPLADASPFTTKILQSSVAVGSGNSSPATQTYNVDLRDLELKVAKARAEAERAERKLMEARMSQGNKGNGTNGIRQ